MWIADMDFAAPDCVLEAMKTRLNHPIMGYFELNDSFYAPIKKWQSMRFGVQGIENQHLACHNSVLGGLISALKVLTKEGDPILVHQPHYTGFENSIKNNNRVMISSPLVQTEAGRYIMDFADMEAKIKEHHIRCAILCSPHNPTGRVWDKEELTQFVALCERYDVKIISDEIWSDFVFDNKKHVTLQSINAYAKQNTIALYAPTKTFNLAGLVIAYSIIYNEELMAKVAQVAEATGYNMLNAMSIAALGGAYTDEGAKWVDELLVYIRKNMLYFDEYIKKNIPSTKANLPEGTYLMWLDLSDTHRETDELVKDMAAKGLIPNNGKMFGGKNHIRINLACPYSSVEKAMELLNKAING